MANKQIDGDSWQNSASEFLPGRYYDSVGLCFIPEMGRFGGDIFVILWRFDDDHDNWVICMRFRYYAGENTDPHTGGDTKSPWKVWTARDESIDEVKNKLVAGISLANLLFDKSQPEFDWLDLKGDCEKAMHIITTTDRPWLHRKIVRIPNPNDQSS